MCSFTSDETEASDLALDNVVKLRNEIKSDDVCHHHQYIMLIHTLKN